MRPAVRRWHDRRMKLKAIGSGGTGGGDNTAEEKGLDLHVDQAVRGEYMYYGMNGMAGGDGRWAMGDGDGRPSAVTRRHD